MNAKHYLVLSGIVGGVIGSLLTALLVSPVTAQRDKFGEIECTGLRVVDEDGVARVMLDAEGKRGRAELLGEDFISGVILEAKQHGGAVKVFGGKSAAAISVIQAQATVVVLDKNGKLAVGLDSTDYGGLVKAHGAHDKNGESLAMLGVAPHGAMAAVWGKGGEGMAALQSDQHGGGVEVYNKDDKLQGRLGITEHGGQIEIYGNDRKPKASLNIDDYGNGEVITLDKHGNRQ